MDQVQPGMVGKAFAEIGGETIVFFHGGHGGDMGEKSVGEDTKSGADFDDGVGGLEVGGIEQDVQDVAVDEEVLAEDARGMEVELRQEGADFGGAGQIGVVGHLGDFIRGGVLVSDEGG